MGLAYLAKGERKEEYVLVAQDDMPGPDDMIAMLNDRWHADFDTVGSIQVYDTMMLLFARPVSNDRK